MGMFLVSNDVKVFVVKSNKDWTTSNLKPHVTKNTNVFMKHEMIVDPTGISKFACTSGCVTIGSYIAECGQYAFEKDGWVMIVPADKVLYA